MVLVNPAKSFAVNPGWVLLLSDIGIDSGKVLRRRRIRNEGSIRAAAAGYPPAWLGRRAQRSHRVGLAAPGAGSASMDN